MPGPEETFPTLHTVSYPPHLPLGEQPGEQPKAVNPEIIARHGILERKLHVLPDPL
jgi:hypothetical protein